MKQTPYQGRPASRIVEDSPGSEQGDDVAEKAIQPKQGRKVIDLLIWNIG